jgi:hypothetical protein
MRKLKNTSSLTTCMRIITGIKENNCNSYFNNAWICDGIA